MASATTITAPKINLTTNDSAVLRALFDNGEGAFPIPSSIDSSSEHTSAAKSQAISIDDSLPSFPRCHTEETTLKSLKDRELAIIRRIQGSASTSNTSYSAQEASSSSPTPIHILQQAIDDLTSLITEHPDYPPLYANRAQALRILIQSKTPNNTNNTDKDAAIFHPDNRDIATKLLSDLSKAISLASPVPTGSNRNITSVSSAQFRLLSNTHMHRGYLLLKAGKIRKEEEEGTNQGSQQRGGGPEQLLSIASRDQLEEMASQDFFEAGRYGNEVAKQLSVQTNPYAKMCGAIVKEALRKEIEEFQS